MPALSFDQPLLLISIALLLFGLVMVYSASIALPDSPRFANYKPTHFLTRHAFALALGAVAGGFIVAFSEVAVTYPWKKIAAYLGFQSDGMLQLLSTEYKFAVSFVILIVVLLFRPTGLFRGKSV